MAGDPHTAPQFDAAALVTIDTQRDVLDGGPVQIDGTSAALPSMQLLVHAFRRARRPIVHIVRMYRPDASNADLCRRALLEAGAPLLLAGAPGTQLAQELLPGPKLSLQDEQLLDGGVQQLGPGEVAIYKPRWGAFFRTPLEDHLRAHGVSTVVFCGCNFPNCPRTSIYEASERDFRVVLARDAISGLYERGERELTNIGVWLMASQEIVDRLAAESGAPLAAGAGT